MAFGPDETPYLLVRQDSAYYLMKLQDKRFEMVRRVGGGSWWFRILEDPEGKLWGVFRDDGRSKTKAYAIDSERQAKPEGSCGRRRQPGERRKNDRQAKSMGKPVGSWHHIATTLASGLYAVRDRHVHRCTGDAWLDIDQADAASNAESKASFFVVTEAGVFRHMLSDGPGVWQHIYSANFSSKEMVFDAKRQQLAIASCGPHRSGAILVDTQGRAKQHKSEGGFWSVAAYRGSFFFRSFRKGVVELTANGAQVVHKINGQPSRNQCLYASSKALFFVCKDKLHRYQKGKWETIEADEANEAISRPTTSNRSTPTTNDLSAREAQLDRVLANLDDDSERLVYADLLSACGDPRGELIVLQLLPKKTLAQKRRITALVKEYGVEWLGPLAKMLPKKGWGFARGFLDKCVFKASTSVEALQEALQHPLLATVSTLDLSGTKISDLTPLARLKGLQTLSLPTTATDLKPLAKLTKLRELDLGTQIEDLAPLAGLLELRKLGLRHAKIKTLKPLAKLTNLEELDVESSQVSSVAPLAKLTKLNRLIISHTKVSSLAPISKLTALKVLKFRSTAVSDLAPLGKLTNLEYLTVSNAVQDVAPLANLSKLRQLCHDGIDRAQLRSLKKMLPTLRIV